MNRPVCRSHRFRLPATLIMLMAVPLAATVGTRASADEFHLTSGARIVGEWLNHDQRPLSVYVIRTTPGIRLTLAASQVAKTVRGQAADAEYDRIAPGFGDSVVEQWKLAEWCREHGLKKQRARHMRRVTELDPNHVDAWHALGYSQLGGRWVTRGQVLQEQGYVFYRGNWRMSQEVELLEEKRRVELAAKQWLVNLKRWRSQIGGDKTREALQNILAVRDPLAISALAYLLQQDSHRPMRLLYVEVLGEIDEAGAVSVLVATSLTDRDVEVFHACLDEIVARKTPTIIKMFARTLQNSDNRRVNRAAIALARLEDPRVIGALIDSLITTHQFTLPGAKPPGTTTTGIVYGPNAPQGSTFLAQGGPTNGRAQVRNHEVLNALVQLSGGTSFGFDQQAWRNWHAIEQNRQSVPFEPRGNERESY